MRILHLSVIAVAALAAVPAAAQGLRGDIHVGLDSLHSDGESAEGVTYGLTLNYDVARRGAVFGVQLDLDATDNRYCERDVIVVGDRACVKARRDTAIGLRAGAAVGAATVVYGTVGYANARFQARYAGAGVTESEGETLDGVRLGLGVSTDFGRRFYGKVEYRYTDYEQGLERYQGLAGVGLRF